MLQSKNTIPDQLSMFRQRMEAIVALRDAHELSLKEEEIALSKADRQYNGEKEEYMEYELQRLRVYTSIIESYMLRHPMVIAPRPDLQITPPV